MSGNFARQTSQSPALAYWQGSAVCHPSSTMTVFIPQAAAAAHSASTVAASIRSWCAYHVE